MPLSITLEFNDAELDYYRLRLRRSRGGAGQRSAQEIAAAAARNVERLRSTVHSPFVVRRLGQVSRLIAMLEDTDWALPEPERARVLDGLAYVAETRDLIPDQLPVLGLADDAIMLELVLRELQHELEGYEDFDAFRASEAVLRDKPGVHRPVSRADWVESKRAALHQRIRERRERDLARDGQSCSLITRF